MPYVDGFVAAVPSDKKAQYLDHAKRSSVVFKECGALSVVECWGDDVPQGKITSFPMAVQCRESETVVFSWVIWPSKSVRDAGWQNAMEDPRMQAEDNPMPFDGKRMLVGGFEQIFEA